MFDETKNLIRDALKAVRQRIEPIEADVAEVKKDLADLKAFRDELKGAGFGDLKADVDALVGKGGAVAKPVDAGQDKASTVKPEGEDGSKAAPIVTTSPTGATVTVDAAAGTTTHTDAAGFTTTLDHATGTATATDADGAPVEPHDDAVAEATIASAIAGVTVQHAG